MNGGKTFLLLVGMLALFAAFGYMLDVVMGTGGTWMMLAIGLALVMNWVSYFYSDKIVLRMYHAREVTPHEAPELHAIVERVAQRAGIPKPRVCVVPSEVPNAFATGRNPQNAVVAANEGLLRLLNRDEVEAVMAHEVGHVANRDTLVQTVAATMAGAIAMLAHGAHMGMLFGGGRRDSGGEGNPFGGLIVILMMLLAPLAATIVQLAISRTREYGADRAASDYTGNPMALASALRKLEAYARRGAQDMEINPATSHMFIVNPLSGVSGMAKLFSTHPSTEDRVARLMQYANMARPS